MAIQFHCPYCTAAIKVGDAAAGKIGSCPKCGTKLRVANPARPEPDSAGTPAVAGEPPQTDAASPPLPAADHPAPEFMPPVEPESPADAAAPEFTFDTPAVQTSFAREVKQRRKGAWGSLMVPLLFAALLAAAAGGYWWYQRETMTGPLTGVRLPVGETLIARIPPGAAAVSRQDYLDAAAGLRVSPAAVSSDMLLVEFRGGAYGIEVWVMPGKNSDLVRVPVRQHPVVAEFYAKHAVALNAPLQAELQSAATGFITDYQNAATGGMVIGNTAEYRNALGLNSLLGGLGYHSVARVGTTDYPCVREDDAGNLYFAVPRGTTLFVVTERVFAERPSVFPGEYRFEVTVTEPSVLATPDEEPAADTDMLEPEPADDTGPTEPNMEPDDPGADPPESTPNDLESDADLRNPVS